MKNLDRRNFISAISCLALTSLTCKASLINSVSAQKESVNDFKKIRRYWQKNETMPATTYLLNRGVCDLSTENEVKNLVMNDFCQDNIITIDGLVLSKTEVAIIVSRMT